jgi:hypothetical protein
MTVEMKSGEHIFSLETQGSKVLDAPFNANRFSDLQLP